MAVDSALKRFSATNLLMPFRGGCFPGTSGIVTAEMQAVSWIYSGIAASTAIIRPLYNFIARLKAFNFNAANKAFNYNAKNKTFGFTAEPGP